MVEVKKKIVLLHRYPLSQIKQTNAAFPYLLKKGVEVKTFKKFDRLNDTMKFWKSLVWVFYSPFLTAGKKYDVIYCDDSFPFYPFFVKLLSPKSKVIIRLGDLHLLYYTSGLIYKILHALEVITWKKVDKIIAISPEMAEYVHKESGRMVDVVLDPVDPPDFHVITGVPRNKIMFHGLLTRNKNVDILLETARLLPSLFFVIIGDGPDRKRLEKAAPINVFFRGWIPFDKVYGEIATCDIGIALRGDNPGNEYVVTSPFLQYSVMGKPCIVTRRKVFRDYEWQFSTAMELAQKIETLLLKPEEGEKNRKHVLRFHNAKKIADELWYQLSF